MPRTVSLLSAVCLVTMALAGPVHAQEDEGAPDGAAPAAVEDGAGIAPAVGQEGTSAAPAAGEEGVGGALGVSPGVVGAPAPAPGAAEGVVGAPAAPEVASTEFEDWRVECYDPPVNGMRCQIVQQLVERNIDQVVLVTSLAYLPTSEQTQIQMVLPLGFLLKRGVTFDVSGYTTSVGVDRCTQYGCFIEGVAAPELLGAMRRGREAQIAIVADSGQTVRIPFSLMGFTAAYNMMERENRAAPSAETDEAQD